MKKKKHKFLIPKEILKDFAFYQEDKNNDEVEHTYQELYAGTPPILQALEIFLKKVIHIRYELDVKAGILYFSRQPLKIELAKIEGFLYGYKYARQYLDGYEYH